VVNPEKRDRLALGVFTPQREVQNRIRIAHYVDNPAIVERFVVHAVGKTK